MEIKNFFYQASLIAEKKTGLKKEKKPEGAKSSAFNTADKVEVSSESARSEKLALIQKRLKSGFYLNNNITSDIGEKLTKVFDPLA